MRTPIAVVLGLASNTLATNPVFEVSFDASLQGTPAFGRLVVYLMHDDGKRGPGASPADGPFPDDPQPMSVRNRQSNRSLRAHAGHAIRIRSLSRG